MKKGLIKATVAFFGVIMVITGLVMWFPFYFPVERVRWMYPLSVFAWSISLMMALVPPLLGLK
ncbi:MAG: hypothetical protein NTW71_11400 [Deltaproteobacteria bacterium]|nr:hypothetical protein [Deltaproteobacteria bacterium]